MQTQLIIVCDASRARVFTAKHKKHLELMTELTHPESREKGSDLVSDRPGHYQKGESARGAYESHQTPKDHEKENFAEIIAHHLEKTLLENGVQQFVMVTPPHFWGLMEPHLSKHVSKAISEVILKDYTSFTKKELEDILQ